MRMRDILPNEFNFPAAERFYGRTRQQFRRAILTAGACAALVKLACRIKIVDCRKESIDCGSRAPRLKFTKLQNFYNHIRL